MVLVFDGAVLGFVLKFSELFQETESGKNLIFKNIEFSGLASELRVYFYHRSATLFFEAIADDNCKLI